jgi:transcription elongation factor GreB
MDIPLKKPMTKKGFNLVADEFDQLVKVERPALLINIANAAAEGDRSENAEYIYSRKRLRELDRRIAYLNSILKDVQVIEPSRLKGDRVAFGSTVTVEMEDGSSRVWMIVGEGETDVSPRAISWKSPIARALMGKRAQEVATVDRPDGDTMDLIVTRIEFVD